MLSVLYELMYFVFFRGMGEDKVGINGFFLLLENSKYREVICVMFYYGRVMLDFRVLFSKFFI